MKLRFTYLAFAICLGFTVIISMAQSGGRAAAQNSGNTGAPGDANATCAFCHATNSQVQISIGMELSDQDGNLVGQEYLPGATYDLKVNINAEMGSPAVYGFQLLALKAPLDVEGDETSEYTEISDNAQKSFASNTGRSYLEHDGASSTNQFSAKWTAPEIGSGPVSFYFCGNGADDSGNTSGDNIACNKVQFDEMKVNNVNTIDEVAELNVFPNPTSRFITLRADALAPITGQIYIADIAGQQLESREVELNTDSNSINIDLSKYNAGIYFVQLVTQNGMISKKIVKH